MFEDHRLMTENAVVKMLKLESGTTSLGEHGAGYRSNAEEAMSIVRSGGESSVEWRRAAESLLKALRVAQEAQQGAGEDSNRSARAARDLAMCAHNEARATLAYLRGYERAQSGGAP